MRITFALPGLDGLSGGLRVVAQYARHLVDAGHEVTLVIRNPGPVPGLRRRIRDFLRLYPACQPLPAGRGHFTGLDVPIVHLDTYRPVRTAQIPDADILISTWWTTAEWAERLPQAKGLHVHFIQGYEDFHPAVKDRVAAVYAQDNVKIVVASWLKRVIAERHGRDTIVVLNGVECAAFFSPEREPNRQPRIGFLLNPHPCKNVTLAIQTAGKLRAQGVHALSFGTPPRPTWLPDWIDYERRPPQNRIAELYAACDLWLFPSQSEGFGLPILEAMASRTPVIATAAGAAPDLIDGLNGQIVSADPDSFAMAIADRLGQGGNAWKAASDAAWSTAVENDICHAGRRFEAALKEAVKR